MGKIPVLARDINSIRTRRRLNEIAFRIARYKCTETNARYNIILTQTDHNDKIHSTVVFL